MLFIRSYPLRVFVFLALFCLFSIHGLATGVKPVLAPGFELLSVETGSTVSLDGLRGKLVYVTFFNEGCMPCRDEVPFLNLLARENSEDLEVIGIGYRDSSAKHLIGVKERMGIEFTVLLDPKGHTAKAYKVWNLPSGYLVNERGELIARHIGRVEHKVARDVEIELARLRLLKSTRSVWIEEFEETTKAAQVQHLGPMVQYEIMRSLMRQGYPVAESRSDAGFVIKGSVSGMGLISGIKIEIYRRGQKKLLEEFQMPQGEDFCQAAFEIVNRLEKY